MQSQYPTSFHLDSSTLSQTHDARVQMLKTVSITPPMDFHAADDDCNLTRKLHHALPFSLQHSCHHHELPVSISSTTNMGLFQRTRHPTAAIQQQQPPFTPPLNWLSTRSPPPFEPSSPIAADYEPLVAVADPFHDDWAHW
jgi:hypothetical protein